MTQCLGVALLKMLLLDKLTANGCASLLVVNIILSLREHIHTDVDVEDFSFLFFFSSSASMHSGSEALPGASPRQRVYLRPFAFDVHPTTQRDPFLWAAGSLPVSGGQHFSSALSFPSAATLQLAVLNELPGKHFPGRISVL